MEDDEEIGHGGSPEGLQLLRHYVACATDGIEAVPREVGTSEKQAYDARSQLNTPRNEAVEKAEWLEESGESKVRFSCVARGGTPTGLVTITSTGFGGS